MALDEKTNEKKNINADSLNNSDAGGSKAMVKILDEKDKIIVSLKEAATKRDKLNENQIRILSNDNADKSYEIKKIDKKLTEIETSLNKKTSQLDIYKDRTENYGAKLENLKTSIDEYRKQIANSLAQVSDMVSVELTKREEKSDKISGLLRENYSKLENKISQVDSNYKEVISKIAEKQVKAKEFIRKALQDLQEALNLLDINSTGIMIDRTVFDDFSHIINESGSAFAELSSRTKEASTIVKNIENVNIQLSSAPKLDGILKDLKEISTGEYKKPAAPLPHAPAQASAPKTVYRGPSEDGLESFMAGVSGQPPSPGAPGTAPSTSVSPGAPGTTPAGPVQSIPGTPGVSTSSGSAQIIQPIQPSRVEGIPTEKKSPDISPQAFFTGVPGTSGDATVGRMTFAPGGQAYFAGMPGSLIQSVPGGEAVPGVMMQPSAVPGQVAVAPLPSGVSTVQQVPGMPAQQQTPVPGVPFPTGMPAQQQTPVPGVPFPTGMPAQQQTPVPGVPGVQGASAGGAATAVLSPPETKGPTEVEAKLSSDETLDVDMTPKGTQSFEAEDDIVTRTSPNLAPYNWDMLPSTSSLLRFRHMLNNAKKAEEKNDYIKALKVYEAVQNQKTIQDDSLALHVLNDQIEAVNRKARAQISDNVKKNKKLI